MIQLSRVQVEFRAYVRRHFPLALADVAREAPRWRRSLHIEDDDGIVLQPSHLTIRNPALRRMTPGERNWFAVGLCWTVLIDEYMWSTHHDDYPRFRELTYFPKLVGECKSACRTHLCPTAALSLVGGDEGNWMETRLDRISLLGHTGRSIEDIVTRVGAMEEMPFLSGLLHRGIDELGIPTVASSVFVEDPLAPDAIVAWRMPRLPVDTLRRTATLPEDHGLARTPPRSPEKSHSEEAP